MEFDRGAATEVTRTDTFLTLADYVCLAVLCSLMIAGVLLGFSRLGASLLHYSTWDVWFESDPPAVVDQFVNRLGRNHLRTSHHPLFSLLVAAPAGFLLRAPFMTERVVFATLLAINGAAWMALMFSLLRALRVPRTAAMVYSTLAAVSASVMFWFPAVEANAFAALSLLPALHVVAASERTTVPWWAVFGACLMSFALTSTNGAVGLLMLVAVLPWRRALITAACVGGTVIALWVLQKAIFPTAGSPLNLNTSAETIYLFNAEALGLAHKVYGFVFHSLVLPPFEKAYDFRLTVQRMLPGQGGALNVVATALWTVLLTVSLWSLRCRPSKTAVVLLATIAAQLAVTLVFGIETFFYSANFGPLLILVASLGTREGQRPYLVALAAILAVLVATNNIPKFIQAADEVQRRYDEQQRFAAQLDALTDPAGLVVCAHHPAAAVGEPARDARDILDDGPQNVILYDDPDTCAFAFDRRLAPRRGWQVPFEALSIENVAMFRRAGARYFVTSYNTGVAKRPELSAWLDEHYRRLDAEFQIYDLAVSQ